MKLKLYLVENRISITDFSKELGCSRMHLNDIVNDKRKCGKSLAQLIEIKTQGEVKAEELLKGE
jgi:plasmid maintenance system antidote protein VapI